jgi:hypothetical protein
MRHFLSCMLLGAAGVAPLAAYQIDMVPVAPRSLADGSGLTDGGSWETMESARMRALAQDAEISRLRAELAAQRAEAAADRAVAARHRPAPVVVASPVIVASPVVYGGGWCRPAHYRPYHPGLVVGVGGIRLGHHARLGFGVSVW